VRVFEDADQTSQREVFYNTSLSATQARPASSRAPRFARSLLFADTEPSAPKTHFRHAILFAEKPNRILMLTLSPDTNVGSTN